MSSAVRNIIDTYDGIVEKLQAGFIPLLLLFCRLWVAWVFFNSGLTKIASWDSTLYLFEFEYVVPLLPWELAAYTGTAAELILPVFLALGLFTRPMAAALFVFNIIAVVSYPLLWEKGFYDHQLWGLMILLNVVWGAGVISADYILKKKFTD
ncbi:NADH dehydrogenase [Vibrio nigripulchritudo ATCC 27043]|uniref:DoxX protein n=2 Tax=Vibrio nigripulchritudo TaxID=28173 RepID=A0AAV2VQ14_9VIBR|nr:DoxX family protein [Vibrio nigripulchritudo]EGU54586.1 NADH dehydrogenase [Vibrio nigripulchritudo ATCC 27043]CCN38103.1 putative DoxX protein [Vibrio nigripulchritudo AM115]CCN43966.1 putative DoxX protein [Vibrio nigripulchritudo FTn2]CCN66749.1 putative DoxX protein [Vibrio nigripulchritudo POn4]CCN74980.1 putative DoxX protein [Vibrio nigripulchritudo SO65]